MIKGRRLHGSVVIQNHKRIGRVEDIVLDPHTGQFQGLLIMPESGMEAADQGAPASEGNLA